MEITFEAVSAVLILIRPRWRSLFFAFSGATLSARSGRDASFDILKAVGIFAVVLIHAIYHYPGSSGLARDFLYFLNNILRFAVPLFFIASGALLRIDAGRSGLIGFFRKKVLRLAIPYLAVAALTSFLLTGRLGASFFYELISGKLALPFYFIIVLFQFYLIFPALEKLRSSRYFLPAALVFSFVGLYWKEAEYIFGVPTFFQYLFFFAYGMKHRDAFCSNKPIGTKQDWLLMAVLSWILFLAIPSFYLNARSFYGPAVFNLLLLSVRYLDGGSRLKKILAAIGANSLWIFLWHYQVGLLVFKAVASFKWPFLLEFFCVFCLTALISWLLAIFLNKMYNILVIFIRN